MLVAGEGATPDETRALLAAPAAPGAVTVGVRPVTDTVKAVRDGFVVETVDRDRLAVVRPVALVPPELVGSLPQPTGDFAAWVTAVRAVAPVRLLDLPD